MDGTKNQKEKILKEQTQKAVNENGKLSDSSYIAFSSLYISF